MKRRNFIKTLSFLPLIPQDMNLSALEQLADSLASTPKMPVLFLGHGSPMNAIEENQFVTGFRNAAKSIPKPSAILCVSAHWYTRGTKVTAMPTPLTIHDFGGFPQALFDVQYPAPGKPELASETQQILLPTPVELDHEWGLDHGTWSVVKHLYPKADIPVLQLSIDYTKPPQFHFDLAKQLSALREKGVLIIGSGNIIHNLRLVDFQNMNKDNYGYDWAIEANHIFHNHLQTGNYKALIDYQNLGKAVQLAIPTPDHYLPLLYVLGLQGKGESISLFNDKLQAGSLSMTSVKIS
jgi:4,5-DOPA dioxygenase extradiol